MKKSDKVGEKAVDVPVNPAPNFGAPNLNPAPDFPAPLLDKFDHLNYYYLSYFNFIREARKKANKKALKDAVKKAQLQFADDSSSSDEEDDRMDLEQVQAVRFYSCLLFSDCSRSPSRCATSTARRRLRRSAPSPRRSPRRRTT